MKVQLRVDGDVPADVASLHLWLREEQAIRAYGDPTWAKSTEKGQMGVVIDILALVIGSGLSALQLALTIAGWRRSRPNAPIVTITSIEPDGTTVRIDTTDPEALAKAVSALERQ